MTEGTKFSAISRSVVIFVFIFHLSKNEANKIDLLRERLKIILEGDGLVLANEAGKKSLSRTLGWMDQYLEDAINKLRNDVGDCHPIRNVYDVLISDVCGIAVSLVNALWLCLGVIAMFSLITVILCVRLAKHLRRAKTGEDIYSEESTSNYGVPLRMFDKFPKLNKKKFSWYVRFIHKSICLFWWIGSWLFMV
ncbi:uncharacterized protein LOC110061975 [Orbicella faveolata]|uniref:uncharacterized protein LOC110061975 n=1 Tax=Orbicella faveolata TaxID=48498 RepID=UPI0009E51723|nr:uncharacterized protein LOC110061975 [Orbicella faveolata]